MMKRMLAAVALAVCVMARAGFAQISTGSGGAVGGVAITTEGLLHIPRTTGGVVAAKGNPAAKRDLVYVSLPRVIAEAKALTEAGKPLTTEVRTLHGLTQIQYLFVYPAEHDLVIAGPAEAVKGDNPLLPVGAATGRPVVQFEDLAVAFRAVYGGGNGGAGPRGRDFFGCSIDPTPEEAETAKALVAKYGTDRPRLLAEMRKAIGPQQVRVFGVPEDSRLALAMVAADYRLKRLSMGLDVVPGVGTALGANGVGRMWFRPSYEPLTVSTDGGSYAIRGKRVELSVGEYGEENGPVPAGIARFTKQFSDKLPEVAARMEVVADLQNVTDEFLVAALVRGDGLERKAGVDLSWMLDAEKFQVAKVTVPRTAETIISITGDQLARGGVAIAGRSLRRMPRGEGDGAVLASLRKRPEGTWFAVAAGSLEKRGK
jgi:hypothetical protein